MTNEQNDTTDYSTILELKRALKKYEQITHIVIKALRRDVDEKGKMVRGEMADELEECLKNAYEVLERT